MLNFGGTFGGLVWKSNAINLNFFKLQLEVYSVNLSVIQNEIWSQY